MSTTTSLERAGRFLSSDGKPLVFLADPSAAPRNDAVIYARPDDVAEGGTSWRELVRSYNKTGDNPFKLYPAYRLYENRTYERLANRFGAKNSTFCRRVGERSHRLS